MSSAEEKKYFVQIPDTKQGEIWDEERYNRNARQLHKDYPSVVVHELQQPYDSKSNIADNDTFTVKIPGAKGAEIWDAARLARNKEQLLKDYPDVEISKSAPVNYWGQELADTDRKIKETTALYDKAAADNASIQADWTSSELDSIEDAITAARKAVQTGDDKRRLKKQLDELYTQRENNPAYIEGRNRQVNNLVQERDAINSALIKLDKSNPSAAEALRKSTTLDLGGQRTALQTAISSKDLDPKYMRDHESFLAAKVMMDDAIETAKAPSRYDNTKTGFGNFFRGLTGELPETLSAVNLAKASLNIHLIDAIKRIQKVEGEDANIVELIQEPKYLGYLSAGEKALVKAFVVKSLVDADRAEDLSLAYQGGQSAAQSLGFMADFIVAGGAGEGVAKAVTKGLTRNLAGISLNAGLKGGARKAALSIPKFGLGTLQSAVKSVVMTPIMPSSWANLSDNITKLQISEDDKGNSVGTVDLSGKKLLKDIGDVFIENLSETAGRQVESIIGIPLHAGAKGLDNIFSGTSFQSWGRAFHNSPVAKILHDAGFNGYIGEIGEEWYGNALRTMLGVDKDALKNFATIEQQIITLSSFAPMTILGGSASLGQYKLAERHVNKTAEALSDVLSRNNYSEEQRKAILDIVKAENPTELAEHLAPVVVQIAKDNGPASEAYKAVMDYADAISKYRVFSGYFEAEAQNERDKAKADIDKSMTTADGRVGQWINVKERETPEGPVTMQTVRVITDEQGIPWYVGSEDETKIALINGGEVKFMDKPELEAAVAENRYADSGPMSLPDYLDSFIARRKEEQDRAVRTQQYQTNLENVVNAAELGTTVNIGSVETPVEATIIQQLPEGYVLQTQDGVTTKTFEEMANILNMPLNVPSESEIETNEADRLERLDEKKKAANELVGGRFVYDGEPMILTKVLPSDKEGADFTILAQQEDGDSDGVRLDMTEAEFDDVFAGISNQVEESESVGPSFAEQQEAVEIPRDFRGNPLPMRTNKFGEQVVDESTLWNQDPEAWARYNDENENRVVDSREKINVGINTLKSEIGKIKDNLSKEVLGGMNPDKMDDYQSALAERSYRLNALTDVLAMYMDPDEMSDKELEQHSGIDINEPVTIVQLASKMFTPGSRGKFNREDFKKELGWSDSELRPFFSFWAKKGHGMSLKAVAEAMVELDDNNLIPMDSSSEQKDTQAARNAIIELFNSASRPSDIFNYIRNENRKAATGIVGDIQDRIYYEASKQGNIAEVPEDLPFGDEAPEDLPIGEDLTESTYWAIREQEIMQSLATDADFQKINDIFVNEYFDYDEQNRNQVEASASAGDQSLSEQGGETSSEGNSISDRGNEDAQREREDNTGVGAEENSFEGSGISQYPASDAEVSNVSDVQPGRTDGSADSGDSQRVPEIPAGESVETHQPEVTTSGEGAQQSQLQEEIAAAEAVVDTEPTDAQKEAGNYRKGHITIDGYDYTIENPKGSVRSGKDASGKEWSQIMNNTYGYIRGTEGVDGDHIDMFISDNPEQGNVYVVDQVRPKVVKSISADDIRRIYADVQAKKYKGIGSQNLRYVLYEAHPDLFGEDRTATEKLIDAAEAERGNALADDILASVKERKDGTEFDEHKVMYGFNSEEEARAAYLSNYEEGWQGLGNITGVSKDEFRKWIESSQRKTKPFAEYASVKPIEEGSEPAQKPIQPKQVNVESLIGALQTKGEAKLSDHVIEEKPVRQAKVVETEKSTYGASNTVVTTEQYEDLKRRMREKLNNLNAGFDPELFTISCQMAAYHIEAGARSFVDFSRRMIEDLGDAIRPYLKSAYNGARDFPGMEDYAKDMDDYESVSNTDVEAITLGKQYSMKDIHIGDIITDKDGNRYKVKFRRTSDFRVRSYPADDGKDRIVFLSEIVDVTPEEEPEAPEQPEVQQPEIAVEAESAIEKPVAIGTISKEKHTKTGEDLWVVKPSERVSAEEFKELKKSAKENNGYWSSFKHGFIFMSETDADKFNNQNITDNERAEEKEQTDPAAVVREAASVASKAEAYAESEASEEAEGIVADSLFNEIDSALEKVNEQLALLGYYEADNDLPFHESYGYMKSAEKKALKDANALARKMANDLGIKLAKKNPATANIAPAGGDIYYRLPLNGSLELYVNIDVTPRSHTRYEGHPERRAVETGEDDLIVTGVMGDNASIMYRVEDTAASGYNQYISGNRFEPSDVTYAKFLSDVRSLVKGYLPQQEASPEVAEEAIEEISNDDILKAAEKITKKRGKTSKNQKNSVSSQQEGEEIFGNLFTQLSEIEEPKTIPAPAERKTVEEVNGFRKGERVSYKGEEATIYDFNYGQPVLDTGMGPVLYELVEWEDIKHLTPEENEPESENVQQNISERDNSGRTAETGPTAQQESERADGVGEGRRTENGRTNSSRSAGTLVKKNTNNNRLERDVEVAPVSPTERLRANIAAIKKLHELESAEKKASNTDMEILRQFTGWGGLGPYFNSRNQYLDEIERELTPEEYETAKLSINSAYYTPAAIINSLWDIASKLGFKGGRILEGSAGIGNILAYMPKQISEASDITAVEIDKVSGGILRLLYPDANVMVRGFEDARIDNQSVDLAITNVPFVTGLPVHDEIEKDLSRKFVNIHDFCIAKNVRKLKEGGIGIFISSNGTLDKSKALRNWVVNEGQSDFIGAFRLNNETFKGTPVTSDIIVIRKRINNKPSENAIDVQNTSVARRGEYVSETVWNRKTYEYEEIRKPVVLEYNNYFIEHPEAMAGEMMFGYEKGDTFRPGSSGLFPTEKKDQTKLLRKWVSSFKEEAVSTLDTEQPSVPELEKTDSVKEGQIVINSKGAICLSRRGEAVPLDVNANKVKGYDKATVVKDYNRLKKAIDAALDYQTEHVDDEGLKPLLDEMNKAYDQFVRKYGSLNRNTAISFLRNDVDFSSIAAVEDYSETQDMKGKKKITTKKTDIFRRRMIDFRRVPTPKDARDGVIVSMNQFGRIDLPYIAKALNKTEDDVRKEILDSKLAYINPKTGNLDVVYDYLSGNVREKLEYAKNNNTDGRYDENIKALEKVVPPDIPAHLIEFSLGSDWIEPSLYKKYAMEKFDVSNDFEVASLGGVWQLVGDTYMINARNERNRSAGVTGEVVKKTVFGHELMIAAMNNVTVEFKQTVKDSYTGETSTIVDKVASQAAQNKVDEMKDDFREWAKKKMLDDAELAERIQTKYNNLFNALVPKEIDDIFIPEHFEGANTIVKLRPHQSRAVIRGTTEPIMLAHEVGSGKTFTLITTAMEMRRLGTAKKPMIVVQNATVGQFVSEAKKLYPSAKIITVQESDRTLEGRSTFYAKIKYNDWDLIIVPQSVFDMIPDSDERKKAFIQEKIDEKMAILEQAKACAADDSVIRQMKKDIEDLEYERDFGEKPKKKAAKTEAKVKETTVVRAKKQLDRRTDDVADFDDMGIDALLIDEAHEYKHLGFATSMQRGVKGVDPSYSKKSAGVYLKTRSIFDRVGWKNVVFATGTPISNTAAEIWTFMKYLMPADQMQANHIYYFDDFVRNFGNIAKTLEFATNGKFKENNRFAAYVNLPELVRIWSSVSDTVLSKDAETGDNQKLSDKLPQLEGGKAQDIYLPQSESLLIIMRSVRKTLDDYEKLSGKEKREKSYIPLTMYGIAKMAAIDPRLVDRNAVDEPISKTNKTVEAILADLKETAEYKGTIAVFCDRYRRWDVDDSGKRVEGFNVFEEIKRKLVEQGLPADQIVIMKSGMNTAKKEKIFSQVNAGEVRVIMGSTQTLGTGVNIQERLHMSIHIDAPDRPMDYTQRQGRILRQGNLHKDWGKTVRTIRFGVEDSLDVTSYQRLKTKASFIDSVMDGKPLLANGMEGRILEEDEEGLFDNPVAILSGSEYAQLKSKAEKDLRKLRNKKELHRQDQIYIESQLKENKRKIETDNSFIKDFNKSIEKTKEHFPDGTVKEMEISGHKAKTSDARLELFNEYISKPIRAKIDAYRTRRDFTNEVVKNVVSFDGVKANIETTISRVETYDSQRHEYRPTMSAKVEYNCPELVIGSRFIAGGASNMKDIISDFVNEIATGKYASERIEALTNLISRLESDNRLMLERRGKPFEDEDKLKEAEARVEEYAQKMKEELEAKDKKYAEMYKDAASTFDVSDVSVDEDDAEADSDSDVTRYRRLSDDISEQTGENSISSELDKEYLDAVNRGDMETAQKMVDEAANAAFPDSKIRKDDGTLQILYHGTPNTEFNTFDLEHLGEHSKDKGLYGAGFYFTPSKRYAELFGEEKRVISAYINMQNPFIIEDHNFDEIIDLLGYEKGDKDVESYRGITISAVTKVLTKDREHLFVDNLKKAGYDGVIAKEDSQYVVFYPQQIKSAETIEKDDEGNVIPLSERFNPAVSDIRYRAISDQEISGDVRSTADDLERKYGVALSEKGKRWFNELTDDNIIGVTLDDFLFPAAFDLLGIPKFGIGQQLDNEWDSLDFFLREIIDKVGYGEQVLDRVRNNPDIENLITDSEMKEFEERLRYYPDLLNGFKQSLYNAKVLAPAIYKTVEALKKYKNGEPARHIAYLATYLRQAKGYKPSVAVRELMKGFPELTTILLPAVENNMQVQQVLQRVVPDSMREAIMENGGMSDPRVYSRSLSGKTLAAREIARKLGVEISIVDPSVMANDKFKWYGRWHKGKIEICPEYIPNAEEAEKTVIHEAVGHNGLRRLVGNENMDAFCMAVFRRLPDSAQEEVSEKAIEYRGRFSEAVEEYLAVMSEDMDFTSEEKISLWDRIIDAFKSLLNKIGITTMLSQRDLRWILWQSAKANTQEDVLNEARRQVLANKLGFSLRRQSERIAVQNAIRMREADDKLHAASLYNRDIVNYMSRLHETWVDKDDAVARLVEALEKASGKKARPFEDIRLYLNQQSSKGLAAIENWEQKYYEPMVSAVKELMEHKGIELADVERYVMLRHGLERNEVFAKRDARDYYKNLYDKAVERINDAEMDEGDKQFAIEREKKHLEKHYNDVELGTDRMYKKYRENDYGGLTALFSTYDDIIPFNPAVESNEEYQARVLKARHPMYVKTKENKDGRLVEVVDMEKTENAAKEEAQSFENGSSSLVENLWTKINAATKATLKHQYDSNMMSRDQYLSVKGMFKYYVPLRGFQDNTAEDMYEYYMSDQRNTFTSPLMKAYGRKSQAESPFGYIGAMASSAVAADIKNETKLALYYFVANRGNNDLISVSDVWYRQKGIDEETGKKIFEPVFPPLSEDLSSMQAKLEYEMWEEDMKKLARFGMAFKGTQKLDLHNSVIHIDKSQEESHIIKFKLAGKDMMMYINGNPRAAQAINNELNVEMSADYQKVFGKILRWFSAINTSYNPEFWLSNIQRDVLFALMSVNIKEDPEYRRAYRKNFIKATKVVSMMNKLGKDKLGNSDLEKKYREFVENGGVTGYTVIKDNEEWEQEIRKYTGDKKKVFESMRKVFTSIQHFGEAMEQMTRFAAYLTSIDKGKEVKAAINDAKELTVNFNRKGSGKAITFKEAEKLRTGDGKPLTDIQKAFVVGASWLPVYGRRFIMFFNASVQGLNALYKLYQKNPSKTALWAVGYFSLGVINAVLHSIFDDDDDYLDIPDYERRNNLLVGGEGAYFKWAMPQETRIFYGLGDMMVNHALGREPHKSIAGEVLSSVSDIAPLNPSGGLAALSPSALSPIVEVAINKDYKGAKIYNDLRYLSDEERKRTPNYQKAYSSTARPYVMISQGLNWITGGDYTDAGLVNINPAAVEHIVEGVTGGVGTTIEKLYQGTIGQILGEDFSISRTPFLSRLLTITDDRYRNAHTTELFDYYKAEAEHTKKRLNQYGKSVEDTEKLDRLYDSKDYEIMQIYDGYKGLMKYYNDQLKMTDDKTERKALMKEQDQYRKDMIKDIAKIK